MTFHLIRCMENGEPGNKAGGICGCSADVQWCAVNDLYLSRMRYTVVVSKNFQVA